MSSIKLESNASGTGIFTIASPNSNTNRTLTLPDSTGTIITTAGGAAISGTTGAFTSTVGVGGATPAASGAGITFPATASESSDANTLDDYEEGSWTPNQGAGLTVVGSFSSTGRYTKVGNVVTVWGSLSGSTSIATTAIGFICTNLPFANTSDLGTTGIACGIWTGTSATFISVGATTSIYSVEAVAAAGSIQIAHTYRV